MRQDMLLAIYMTPQGPKLETKGDPNFLLRVMASVMEDMRQKLAVDAALLAIKAEAPRIELVPANGVPKIG